MNPFDGSGVQTIIVMIQIFFIVKQVGNVGFSDRTVAIADTFLFDRMGKLLCQGWGG